MPSSGASRLTARVRTISQGLLEPYQADETQVGVFRARQLQAVLKLTPMTMTANVLNASLVCWSFWDASNRFLLAAWLVFVMLLALWGVRRWTAMSMGVIPTTVSRDGLRRSAAHASLVALAWASVLVGLFADADLPHQIVLGVVSTGMICAGAFALTTVPLSALSYVLIVAGGSALALVNSGLPVAAELGALLAVYSVTVIASVLLLSRTFGSRLMAEAAAERQNQVIGLLLRDFEENTSDVLWEIDGQGRFCNISSRLLAAFGWTPSQLAVNNAADLFARLGGRGPIPEGHAPSSLLDHLSRGAAFRDVVVPLVVHGMTRWWSFTAKPLFDTQGRPDGWRGVATDVTQTQHATDQLTFLAHFDPLTGLTNRHQFRHRLEELLTPRDGMVEPCAVLCIDLDNFKTINDTLGHAAGDVLLQVVAARLSGCTRREDVVARLGGDEFAIVMRGIQQADEIEAMAHRVLGSLDVPCEVQGASVSVRASIGIALAPRDGDQIDALLSHADLALYAAKRVGRGEFRFFAPQMMTRTRRRTRVEQALRDALARGELYLVFQPQINLRQWEVTGFEALVRWRHPELGDVEPGEFIPLAEEAGLIYEIGVWVMREACHQASQWPSNIHVAVNVSGVQVMSQQLPEEVSAVLAQSGLAPQRLEVEITESIFLNETRASMEVLRAVHALGVRIALDDFGTGYSSLAYLRRFPFHTLKIDRAFVRELMTRRDARAIVKTIVGLATTLQMDTVAEGVEESSQVDVLYRYGCDVVQGHYVAKPLAAHEVLPFLHEWSDRTRPAEIDETATAMMPLSGSTSMWSMQV